MRHSPFTVVEKRERLEVGEVTGAIPDETA